MFKNYIKIAFRNLIKNRSHTIINVVGLSLGLTCAVVIFLVIQYEQSFDSWHADSDRIYRIVRQSSDSGSTDFTRGVPTPLSEAVQNEVYGVEAVTIIDRNTSEAVLSVEREDGSESRVREGNTAFVQSDYFDIFTHEWVRGDPETSLEQPNSVVITRSLAESLFGDEDPIGQSIAYFTWNNYRFEVTGVIEDPRENTDFPIKFYSSHHSLNVHGEARENNSWQSFSTETESYVKLASGVEAGDVNQQLETLTVKYQGENEAEVIDYLLQPLSDVHFDTRFGVVNGYAVDRRSLLAIGLVGFLLLFAACINFINLNTAIAARRSKEVGLRKTMGGTRSQLTLYFLCETAFITLFSVVLSLLLVEIATQGLGSVLGYVPRFELLSNGGLVLFIVSLFGFVTLAAGWYPARYLSGFSPVKAMKGTVNMSYGSGLKMRRGLIVVQFMITQALIICTVIIASQMNLFQNRDMGFDREAIVEVQTPFSSLTQLELFRSHIDGQPGIISMAYSNNGTTGGTWAGNYRVEGDSLSYTDIGQIKFVEAEFLETYGVELLEGRNVRTSDTVQEYLVNEIFAERAGYGGRYDELIGLTVEFWDNRAPIVGVINDFNTESLHEPVSPLVLTSALEYSQAGIKIDMSRTSEALAAIEQAYTVTFPEYLFEYEFLDDVVAGFYQSEQRTANLMKVFTVVAILLGCLGLYGLVSYMAVTRTKEIGVRKVLGASVAGILGLFGKEFLMLTGLAFLISSPIAWLVMTMWLTNFAYQVEIGVGIFLLAGGLALVVALATVSWQSVRAALANPVESLRSE